MKDKELNDLQEKYYYLVLYGNIKKRYEKVKKLSSSNLEVIEEIVGMYPDECRKIDINENQIKFNEGFWSAIKYIRNN